jgi:hypothetical protein
MNKLKFYVLTVVMMLLGLSAISQEKTDKDIKLKESSSTKIEKTEPQATHTYKSGGKPSVLTQKVIELAEGDDIAAEKTVRYLKTERVPKAKIIVSDEEFARIGSKESEGVVSESEVKELINQFK